MAAGRRLPRQRQERAGPDAARIKETAIQGVSTQHEAQLAKGLMYCPREIYLTVPTSVPEPFPLAPAPVRSARPDVDAFYTGVRLPSWCLNTTHWLGGGKSIIVQFNNKAVRDEVYRNRVPKEIQQVEQGPEWPCSTACRRAHRRRRTG